MKKNKDKNFFDIITGIVFILDGMALMLYGAVMMFAVNCTVGVIGIECLGIMFVVGGVAIKRSVRVRWILAGICAVLICIGVPMGFISSCFGDDTADVSESAIIVLGAGLDGENVSPQLAGRLDRAAEYCKINTDAVIVVSGGQGIDEKVTEAYAMERYLISKGIDADRILKEEESTSTYTNFANSKKKLDDYFEGEYTVAFITSDYHTYRAGIIADNAGLVCTHISSKTAWYELPVRCMRECVAVAKLWIFGAG